MSGFVETSTEGLVLDWRPHLLEDLARHERLDVLALEPALRREERAPQNVLAVAADHRGLRWEWADWQVVELAAAERTIARGPGDAPEATWGELGNARGVEVTPRRADGAFGTTRLVERPRPRVGFRPEHDDRVRIVVAGAPESARLRAELYELEADRTLRPAGRTCDLRWRGGEHSAAFAPGASFFGAIAVVESGDGYARLVDWRSWVESRLEGKEDAAVEASLRARVEGYRRRPAPAAPAQEPGGAFLAWPRRSRERLAWLAARADWFSGEGPGAIERVTGTFRAVLLRELGTAEIGFSRELAERLSAATFAVALGRLEPQLPAALEALHAPDSRLWVLRHAREPRLAEIVRLGGDEVARLERARQVVDLERRLGELAARVGDGAMPRVKSLRDEAGRFLAAGGALATVRLEVERLEEQVAREDAGQIGPDPPVTPGGLALQARRRSECRDWRLGLQRVLAYCETGIWKEAAGREPDAAELRQRLASIAGPPSPRRADLALAKAVADEIERLEREATHESDPELSRQALGVLLATVRPRAGDWAGLRCDVLEAGRRRPAFAWLDREAPPAPAPADLARQGSAARQFLDLLDRVERHAAERPDSISAGLTVEVFATPGHPHSAQLAQEIRQLAEDLRSNGERVDATLPPFEFAGGAPGETLAAWWEHLDRTVCLRGALAARYASHRRNLESLEPVLAPARGAASFWRTLPESARPAYAPELLELVERAYSGRAAALGDLARLASFLAVHRGVMDDWHRAAGQGGRGDNPGPGDSQEDTA
jgi:hypothetical protein